MFDGEAISTFIIVFLAVTYHGASPMAFKSQRLPADKQE
jgi:hypothetical protein